MSVINGISTAGRPATSAQEIDRMVGELRAGAKDLATSSLEHRICLAQECIRCTSEVAQKWVQTASQSKRISLESTSVAEEILSGPVSVLRYLQLILQTLRELRDRGEPQLPGPPEYVRGQVRVNTFPSRILYDSIAFRGITAATWLQPEISAENIFGDSVARLTRRVAVIPKVTTVLGAGNVSAIPATDALTSIFQNDSAVLLKMNPVNEYLGPLFEQAFRPLIQADFLRIVFGGAEQGRHAVSSPGIEQVHITGSKESHDAIVWGSDPENQRQRRRTGQPIIAVPVTSELGNVTPWAIVPGKYSSAQLMSQAENIAASVVNNASFNCIATKMLITWKRWPDRERFLNLIESILAKTPQRCAYYPGAGERFAQFSGTRREPDEQGRLPWTLRRDLSRERELHLFERESFVCVTGEVTIDAATPEQFMDRAVDFMNEHIWGTLAASLTVPNEFRRTHSAALDAAISRLRYGTIGINQWTGVAYGLMSPPWGAFPVDCLRDVQSGLGFVHNTLLLDRPQKTVIQSPLSLFPRPVWFSTNRRPAAISWKLCRLYSNPAVWMLPGLLTEAIRG